MLVGNPGTRKSTAIKVASKLLKKAGYESIAADRTSKEKFLLDLQDGLFSETSPEEVLEGTLWTGNELNGAAREVFIAADEFNDFIGSGNIDFLSLLGTLWDYEGIYRARVKNSKSVTIPEPTVNILSGNTSDRLAAAIPIEAIGQGFISRILLIHGERTGKKIPIPKEPPNEETEKIVNLLQKIKNSVRGAATIADDALDAFNEIYTSWEQPTDSRFASYSTRRFTHLLKLSLVSAAARISCEIRKKDVILSNTILTLAESLMPKALGEFGKGKNSDVAHKIIETLDACSAPMSVTEIFKAVATDLDKISDLANILMNLDRAEKIQKVGSGFLPRRKTRIGENSKFLDWSLLLPEELGKQNG